MRERARLRTAGGERQTELFAQGHSPGARRPQPQLHTEPGEFRWNDPDPSTLSVGNLRLEAFLRAQGLTEVLLMRQVLRSRDWSAFQSSYRVGGRLPYHPAALVGLILFGITRGISSLRGIEEMGRSDVRCWWLTGGLLPDHSALGKFINRHGSLLSGELFEQLTQQILDRAGARGGSIAIDGTVVRAAGSRYHTLRAEAARQAAEQAQQQAQQQPDSQALRNKADLAQQAAEQAHQRSEERKHKGRANTEASVAPSEPDAVVQPTKEKLIAPAYKPSVGANAQRIITGFALHPCSETAAVGPIVQQHERTNGQRVQELMLDAGYFSGELLQRMCEQDISVLCPQGKSSNQEHWEKTSDKQLLKNEFRYDQALDLYVCPNGRKLRFFGVDRTVRRYRSDDCSDCPRRKSCCTGAGGRTIRRYEQDQYKEAMREVMRHPQARARYRRRQTWVEPVFSELKGVQGLVRFARKGLASVRLEFALHCLAHNFRRLLALAGRAWGGRTPPWGRPYDPIWALWATMLGLITILATTSPARAPLLRANATA